MAFFIFWAAAAHPRKETMHGVETTSDVVISTPLRPKQGKYLGTAELALEQLRKEQKPCSVTSVARGIGIQQVNAVRARGSRKRHRL